MRKIWGGRGQLEATRMHCLKEVEADPIRKIGGKGCKYSVFVSRSVFPKRGM